MKEWFVVTGDGALRMAPSVMVGESSSGALTLNDPEEGCQWVEFVLVGNDPWLTIVTPNKSLRVAGVTCLRHPLWAGTSVRLPNHTLYISHDIRMPQHSGTEIELVHRNILERLVGPRWTLAEASEPSRPRQRQLAVLALAAVALAGVAVLLVPMGEGESARLQSADWTRTDTPPVSAPAETPPPAAGEVTDGVADGGRSDTVDVASFELAPPTPVVAPVVVPPVERRTIPPVALAPPAPEPSDSEGYARAEQAARAERDAIAQRDARAEQAARARQAALAAAEREEIAAMSQAAVAELSRQRDLLAADLALAQGRLTSPPEENAYALYSRVLSVDPESPEATGGLRAVRQELINRALAQLAGDDLEGSRRTLQAAAQAGVEPQLVANLRAEVDYRQQLMDAR